jgi:ATP-dependent exoDNAse (exonuclease V) beta subunit
MTHPSQLAEAGIRAEAAAAAAPGDGEVPRLRGEIIHRGLENLARGRELPTVAGLSAALRQAGLEAAAAAQLAPELLQELEACRRDPWLARLLDPNLPAAASEWLIEDLAAPDTLRRGQIDRLAFDGETWWIIDYKTSRPEKPEAWEEFIARETEKYRPQLLAYREMTAKAKGMAPGDIKLALYFTACRRAVEL